MILNSAGFAYLNISTYIESSFLLSNGKSMFTTFDNNSLFILPVCFHPTTTMLVDDDENFLQHLARYLMKQLPISTFTDPDVAIRYFEGKHQPLTFRERCLPETHVHARGAKLISAIRNELYNPNRFKEVLVTVVDYNMPNKTGFDLMQEACFPQGIPFHSYILLTGASLSELDETFSNSAEAKNLISKSAPDYLHKLTQSIHLKSTTIMQWCSYEAAIILSRDPKEKNYFLFDGNFLPILNQHIKENAICELYLFDRQGSYLFLDEQANPSWLFVRNELGIENTIKLAERHHAPHAVIEALKSKKMILSLYEEADFKSRKVIDWEDYLLPATQFEGDDAFIKYFHLKPRSNYYFAFTKEFKEHGIYKEKILSYREFLDMQ